MIHDQLFRIVFSSNELEGPCKRSQNLEYRRSFLFFHSVGTRNGFTQEGKRSRVEYNMNAKKEKTTCDAEKILQKQA
jgi:hypothetical protein